MEDIYCVMFTGIPLDDEIRNFLLKVAQKMVDSKKSKVSVKNEELEGLISTKWLRKGIGSTFGIEFLADIDTLDGSTKVTYIVPSRKINIEDGFWLSIPYSPAYEPINLN